MVLETFIFCNFAILLIYFQINPDDGYKLSEATQATIAGNAAPGERI